MFIIGLITRGSLPAGVSSKKLEEYTLALEMGLITHSKYARRDGRNMNTNISPGFRTAQYKDGYIIYVVANYSDCKPEYNHVHDQMY